MRDFRPIPVLALVGLFAVAAACSDAATPGPGQQDALTGPQAATSAQQADPSRPGPAPDAPTPAPSVEAAPSATLLTFPTDESPFDAGIDNQGWYSPGDQTNNDGNDNYIVGMLSGSEYRNFFTFDLSSLSEGAEILSATLEVTRYSAESNDETETYSIFDVTTDAAAINSNQNYTNEKFNDLGTGTAYGSFEVSTSGSSNDVLAFSLNDAAIADIEAAAGGFFTVGGCVPTADDQTETLYGFSGGGGTQRLVLEVAGGGGGPAAQSSGSATSSAVMAEQVEIVPCAGELQTGSLEAAAATTGPNPDPNGYDVSLDGGTQTAAIGTNGSFTFEGLDAGDHTVELSDVAPNCTVGGDNPRTVTVQAGRTATTTFAVTCSRLVDIKPESSTNEVALGDPGLLPVAVLTSPEFDATDVDPTTVTLGDGAGPETPVSNPDRGGLLAELRDVDADGDLDMLLWFEIPALVDNGDLEAATESLLLQGQTTGGTPFQGRDAVNPITGRDDSSGDGGFGGTGRGGTGGGDDDGRG